MNKDKIEENQPRLFVLWAQIVGKEEKKEEGKEKKWKQKATKEATPLI